MEWSICFSFLGRILGGNRTFALAGAFVWLVYRWWISFWLCSLFFVSILFSFMLSSWVWFQMVFGFGPCTLRYESWFLIFAFWLLISFSGMTLRSRWRLMCLSVWFSNTLWSCRSFSLFIIGFGPRTFVFAGALMTRFWWTTFPCASFPLRIWLSQILFSLIDRGSHGVCSPWFFHLLMRLTWFIS